MHRQNLSPKNPKTAYIYLRTDKVETTKEILNGKIYADFDAEGNIVGFEFLDPLKVELDGVVQ